MDLESILKIMDRFDRSNMTSFCLEEEDFSLTLESKKKQVVAAAGAPVVTEVVPQAVVNVAEEGNTAQSEGTLVKSPLVGTFYAAKAEGEAPFVSVGDKVTKGQVIGIIEAMKLMNEIEAEADGTVAEILVENEQLVEYGQPLIRLV